MRTKAIAEAKKHTEAALAPHKEKQILLAGQFDYLCVVVADLSRRLEALEKLHAFDEPSPVHTTDYLPGPPAPGASTEP